MWTPIVLIFGSVAIISFLAVWAKTPSRFSEISNGKTVWELREFTNYGYVHPDDFRLFPTRVPQAGYLRVRRKDGPVGRNSFYIWAGARVFCGPPTESHIKVTFYGRVAPPMFNKWMRPEFPLVHEHDPVRGLADIHPGQRFYVPNSRIFFYHGQAYLRHHPMMYNRPGPNRTEIVFHADFEKASLKYRKDEAANYNLLGDTPGYQYYPLELEGFAAPRETSKEEPEPQAPLTLYDHLLED